MVSHKSSMIKSIIWRIMGFFVLGAVTYYFTRHWVITTQISIVHHATFVIVFYLHERFWLNIHRYCWKWKRFVKPFTYEIILGMGVGGLIVLIFTGQWKKVSQITPTYTAIKLVMYYINEKVWAKIENR